MKVLIVDSAEHVGGGGGRRVRLEGVSFYKRFLSRPVNAPFHSNLEITSAKNTLPKYSTIIYVKNKSTKFQLY